ncbi:MAG: metallophosphoesterase [Candidatus Parvarchaeota archaeon]|nr:metallophosphoesterase [Candidatus Parvarchaeota archaeon]
MDIDDIPFTFTKGRRHATLDEYGIIGDIHLGFEREMEKLGYNVGRLTDIIIDEILRIKSKKLIILGDIRSDYGPVAMYERGVIFKLLKALSNSFEEVIITKGNHDSGIDRFTSKFRNVKLVQEFLYKNICFLHGYKMPSKAAAASSDMLVLSHLHPVLFFRDSNGVAYREDCWLFFDLNLPREDYRENRMKYGFVFPSFNRFIGGTDDFRRRGIIRYADNIQAMTMNLIIVNTNSLKYRYR